MRKLPLLGILLAAASARAAVPGQFSVQGVLRDGSGSLQSKMVSVTVSLLDAQSGGNVVYGPTQPTTVVASDGLFTVNINDSMLPATLFNSSQLWMQVNVDGTTFPAQQVSPQLMSLRSGRADEANELFAQSATSVLEASTAGSGANSICSGLTPTTGSAAPLYFGDYNLAHVWMTVTATGQLGIGITDPGAKLQVNDGSYASTALQTGNSYRFWTAASPTANALLIGASNNNQPDDSLYPIAVLPNKNVGINTVTPGVTLDVNGTVRAPTVTQTSDARLKTDVRTLEHALDDLAQLRGVRFRWKKDGKPSLGVIAQEVERVFPELVFTDAQGMKSVDYAKLTAVLIEGHKALAQSVRELRDENAALRQRLDRLERAMSGSPAHTAQR